MTNAMSSFMSLCGNEITNAARLKAYVDHGIRPSRFNIIPRGCDGLDAIIPAAGSEPPVDGYGLPELDPAPWYDISAPESQNFAGLMVTEVTVSAPYTRTVTDNIGTGQTLGRLKVQGRSLVVKGWLIGKTCCATGYGLKWLTSVLAGGACPDGKCDGCTLDYLDCCPTIGEGEGDCIITDGGIYVRPEEDAEYARADDFFRRMNGVGVSDGPNVLDQKGSSCGCGGSPLVEVEFTLASSSPYFNSFGTAMVIDQPLIDIVECDAADCNFTWLKVPEGEACPVDPECPEPADCLEDPLYPMPSLPPEFRIPWSKNACTSMYSTKIMVASDPGKKWGSSTLNIDIFSGSTRLRQLALRLWKNPDPEASCDVLDEPDCAASSTLLIQYIPPNSHFIVSGENRTVTIECDGNVRNASQNITNVDGQPFDWPDLDCFSVCLGIEADCLTTANDATIDITRIDREL